MAKKFSTETGSTLFKGHLQNFGAVKIFQNHAAFVQNGVACFAVSWLSNRPHIQNKQTVVALQQRSVRVTVHKNITVLQPNGRAILIVLVAVGEKQRAPEMVHNHIIFHAAVQKAFAAIVVVATNKVQRAVQGLRSFRKDLAISKAAEKVAAKHNFVRVFRCDDFFNFVHCRHAVVQIGKNCNFHLSLVPTHQILIQIQVLAATLSPTEILIHAATANFTINIFLFVVEIQCTLNGVGHVVRIAMRE